MAAAPLESRLNVKGLLRTLLRYKWLVLASTLVVPTIATLYGSRLPKVYQATATLEFNPTPPRPLGQEVEDVADPIGSYWTSREWQATQNRVLASRALCERVVRKLALHQDASFFYVPEGEPFEPVPVLTAVHALQSRLSVEQEKSTRLVHVSVTDRDPARAQLIANTLASSYSEKMAEDRMRSTVEALDWLRRQLDSQRAELQSSEIALHKFKERNDVLSVSLEDRQNMVARNLESYGSALTAVHLEIIGLKARVKQLREIDLSDPTDVPDVFPDDTIRDLRSRLRQVSVEREELAVLYGPHHPSIQSLDAKLATLREQMGSEIRTVVSGVEAALDAARSREASIREALAQANVQGMELNRREIEYRTLLREAKNDEELYSMLLERSTETNLTRLLDLSKVMILEPALKPSHPIKPRLSLFVLSGLLGGLLLGAGWVFAITGLDTTVKSAADIEGTGVAVLGVLPVIAEGESKAGTALRRRRKKLRGHAYNPQRDLIVHTRPSSSVAECCRTIRTNLSFMSADSTLKTLMVTSANPLEGKTTVAVSIAISLAQSGQRVLFVDTDLRRPRAHRTFDLPNDVGVTSVLVGQASVEEAVQDSDVPNLSVLTAGPIPPNPAELLQMGRFRDIMGALRERYDRVVFDSPPLGAVIDAAIIGSQVAGSVLVAQADSTRIGAAKSAIRMLRDVNASIVGAVINGVELGKGEYGYSQYYYYGYYAADEPPSSPDDPSPPLQPAASS